MSSQYLCEAWSGIAARLRLESCQQALRCALTSSQHRRGRGLEMLSRKTALKLLHSLICMVGWSGVVSWYHWWAPLPGRGPWERLLWAGKLSAEPQTTVHSWSFGLSCHRLGEFGMGSFRTLLWMSWL